MPNERHCSVCGDPLPTDARSDAKFCSPGCRQKAARSRDSSQAHALVGGIVCPVVAFECDSHAFGRIGTAILTVPAHSLRGVEFRHSAAGTLPVELRVGDALVFEGDMERLVHAADTVQVIARCGLGRLAGQRWGENTWAHLSLAQFAEGAAQRAGLNWIPPEVPLEARALASFAEADGSASGGSRNALELLLLASRELGYEFAVRGGALSIGPSLPAEPRAIAGRNAAVTTHDSNRVAVVARSSLLTLVGGGIQPRWLRTSNVATVPAGLPVYLAVLPAEQTARAGGRVDGQVAPNRQFELDRLHARLVAEITAGMLAVECETDAHDLRPYEQVRLEAAGEKPLLVTRVTHSFTADAGLATHLEALHLPPAPTLAASPTRIAPRVVAPWSIAA